MSAEQVAKYEAWAVQLQGNIESLARQRKTFFRMLVGFVAASTLGFFFGAWLGVATIATGVMVTVAGVYITTTRTLEYQQELARTRFELDRLRASE